MSNVKDLTLSNFEDQILKTNASQLKVVKFGADWCGPCRMMAPILDSLSKKYTGKVDFYEVDSDKDQELSAQFGIRGIPAVFLLKDGKVVNSFVGLRSESDFAKIIDSLA